MVDDDLTGYQPRRSYSTFIKGIMYNRIEALVWSVLVLLVTNLIGILAVLIKGII